MRFHNLIYASIIFILAGIALTGAWLLQPVTVWVDGQAYPIRSLSLTTGDVLRIAGLGIRAEDRLSLPAGPWLLNSSSIRLERAVPVEVYASGKAISLVSAERIPANLLMQAGYRLYPGDTLLENGAEIDPLAPLPRGQARLLQFRPAISIQVIEGDTGKTVYSNLPTLAEALWQQGIRIGRGDQVAPVLETPLTSPLSVTLIRARPLDITLSGGTTVSISSSAQTVGQALSEAGLSVQGLDYTQPAEDQPAPAGGQIHLVRVREEIRLEQKSIPYKSTYQADSNTELDTQSIITPGVTGIRVSRVRYRYEDGEEVSRRAEAEWVARQPVDQVVGLGTQVVLHNETVDGVALKYWRKVTAYATSYAPCENGPDQCSRTTASGLPLKKGIIAVIPSWYYMFKGTQVYIPGYGYGTIADIGGGIAGKNWVDLGYSDNDYIGWHSNVTVYFLAPAPASAPWQLP